MLPWWQGTFFSGTWRAFNSNSTPGERGKVALTHRMPCMQVRSAVPVTHAVRFPSCFLVPLVLERFYHGDEKRFKAAKLEFGEFRQLDSEADALVRECVASAWDDVRATGFLFFLHFFILMSTLHQVLIELMCHPAAASMVESAWSGHLQAQPIGH